MHRHGWLLGLALIACHAAPGAIPDTTPRGKPHAPSAGEAKMEQPALAMSEKASPRSPSLRSPSARSPSHVAETSFSREGDIRGLTCAEAGPPTKPRAHRPNVLGVKVIREPVVVRGTAGNVNAAPVTKRMWALEVALDADPYIAAMDTHLHVGPVKSSAALEVSPGCYRFLLPGVEGIPVDARIGTSWGGIGEPNWSELPPAGKTQEPASTPETSK